MPQHPPQISQSRRACCRHPPLTKHCLLVRRFVTLAAFCQRMWGKHPRSVNPLLLSRISVSLVSTSCGSFCSRRGQNIKITKWTSTVSLQGLVTVTPVAQPPRFSFGFSWAREPGSRLDPGERGSHSAAEAERQRRHEEAALHKLPPTNTAFALLLLDPGLKIGRTASEKSGWVNFFFF